MSYEPRLIINKHHLEKHENAFMEEQYHSKSDIKKRVAEFLLNEIASERNCTPIKFAKLELIISQPELTSFNAAVRKRLDDLEIEYQVDN